MASATANSNFNFFFFFFFFPFSSKSGTFLRGVVVPGGCGSGGAHLHPAAGFHPHYQGTEQKVCQEVRIRWVHTISQLNGAFNSYRSVVPFLLPSGTEGQESDDLTFSSTFMRGGLDDLQFSNTEQWTWANFFFFFVRGGMFWFWMKQIIDWVAEEQKKKAGEGEGVGGILVHSVQLWHQRVFPSAQHFCSGCLAARQERGGGSLWVTAHLSDWREKQEVPSHSNTKTLSKPPYPPLGIWPRPLDLPSGLSVSVCLRNHQLTSSSPAAATEVLLRHKS